MKYIIKSYKGKKLITVSSLLFLFLLFVYFSFEIADFNLFISGYSQQLFYLSVIISFSIIGIVNLSFSKNKLGEKKVANYSMQFLYLSILLIVVSVFFLQIDLQALKSHLELSIALSFLFFTMSINSVILPMIHLGGKLNNTKYINYSFILGVLSLFTYLILINLKLIKLYFLLPNIFIAFSILFYLRFIYESFKYRINKAMEYPLKFIYISIINLVLTVLLLVFSPLPLEDENISIDIISALQSNFYIGVILPFIFGYFLRSISFYIWSKKIAIIKEKKLSILPKNLYSADLAKLNFSSYILAYFLYFTGSLLILEFLIIAGNIIMLISLIFFALNILKIIRFNPEVH